MDDAIVHTDDTEALIVGSAAAAAAVAVKRASNRDRPNQKQAAGLDSKTTALSAAVSRPREAATAAAAAAAVAVERASNRDHPNQKQAAGLVSETNCPKSSGGSAKGSSRRRRSGGGGGGRGERPSNRDHPRTRTKPRASLAKQVCTRFVPQALQTRLPKGLKKNTLTATIYNTRSYFNAKKTHRAYIPRENGTYKHTIVS